MSPAQRPWLLKLATLALTAAIVVGLWWQFGHELTLPAMAARETQLRRLIAEQPLLMYAAAFVVYVAVTGLSLPGATVLTLTYGWLFGFWRCLVLVSFASTTGATVAFLLSRFLFREAIQSQFGDRLEKFNEALRREGAFYLFTLRLVPQVPFFVINAVMGLTPLPTWTFWWVSQVGMLPGTAVYTWAGASVKDLRTLAERGVGELLTPQMFAAFLVLGLFPWIVKWLVAAFRKSTSSTAANHPPPG